MLVAELCVPSGISGAAFERFGLGWDGLLFKADICSWLMVMRWIGAPDWWEGEWVS